MVDDTTINTPDVKTAECECCPNVVPEKDITVYMAMRMCPECLGKEKALQDNLKATAEDRVADSNNRMNQAISAARAVDDSITVRTDLFNAATVSIVELKAAIDHDGNIENKNYALAEELTRRFSHFKDVIFEANAQIVEATNNQKAIQVYLNQLANSLRTEEREKLKIADINYQPKSVKVVKPAAIKTAKKKLDKVELRKYASELGIPEFTLQMLVVSKGITVEQAANMLRKSIKEAKSESDNLPTVDMSAQPTDSE